MIPARTTWVVGIVVVAGFAGFVTLESKVVRGYVLHEPIYMDGDTAFAENATIEGWPGDGSEEHPYIIEGLEIDAGGRFGFDIGNTDLHFVVRDCYVHSGPIGVFGIRFTNVTYGTIARVDIMNFRYGIYMSFTNQSNIIGTKISTSDDAGILLVSSNSNTVSNSYISDATYGVILDSSLSNILVGNNISLNQHGVSISLSSDNKVFHNNIAANVNQAYDDGNNNHWYGAYPIGGNYWSDYTGVDQFSGPSQNTPSSDGIGDSPYAIDGDSRDMYPLMQPSTKDSEPPSVTITSPANDTTVGASSQTVSGTATDNLALMSVKARAGTGEWAIAAGTNSWAATLTLLPGDNEVEAQAFDAAGNPSMITSIHVFYDNEKPAVSITCDRTDADVGVTVTCTVMAADNRGTPRVSWAVKKGGVNVSWGMTNIITFNTTEVGTYAVEATVTDGVGNSNTTSLMVTVKEKPSNVPSWMVAIILIAVLATVITVVLLLKRRRKLKETDEKGVAKQRKREP